MIVLISASFAKGRTKDRDGEGEVECSSCTLLWTCGCWVSIELGHCGACVGIGAKEFQYERKTMIRIWN